MRRVCDEVLSFISVKTGLFPTGASTSSQTVKRRFDQISDKSQISCEKMCEAGGRTCEEVNLRFSKNENGGQIDARHQIHQILLRQYSCR